MFNKLVTHMGLNAQFDFYWEVVLRMTTGFLSHAATKETYSVLDSILWIQCSVSDASAFKVVILKKENKTFCKDNNQ